MHATLIAPSPQRTPAGRGCVELARVLERVAAAVDPRRDVPAGGGRRWRLLSSTADHEAWLIAWPAGTGLALHDHDGAAAAVRVVRGRLRERWVVAGRAGLATRWLAPGGDVLLPPDHVHEVRNTDAVEAVSVHVYDRSVRDLGVRAGVGESGAT